MMPNMPTKEVEALAQRISHITNILGKRMIKVAQMRKGLISFAGTLDLTWKQVRDYNPDENEEVDDGEYKQEVTGNNMLEFTVDPFPSGIPVGTGKVAYLFDDEEDTPRMSKSGAEKGWNRDWLASHYNDGIKIVGDPDIEEDVKRRYDNILKKLADEKPQHDLIVQRMIAVGDQIERKRTGQSGSTHVIEKHVVQGESPDVSKLVAQMAELQAKMGTIEAEKELYKGLLSKKKDETPETKPKFELNEKEPAKEGSFAT